MLVCSIGPSDILDLGSIIPAQSVRDDNFSIGKFWWEGKHCELVCLLSVGDEYVVAQKTQQIFAIICDYFSRK